MQPMAFGTRRLVRAITSAEPGGGLMLGEIGATSID